MKSLSPVRLSFFLSIALFASALLASCVTTHTPPPTSQGIPKQTLDGFPYHPLPLHLDLSILTYQIYSQSLVWPFDPYYEDSPQRTQLMDNVRAWTRTVGANQVQRRSGIHSIRGPGVLSGFPDNPSHDPILYRYDRIYPWSDSVTGAIGEIWTEYRTPQEITNQIRDVYVCYRPIGQPEGTTTIKRLSVSPPPPITSGSRDVLLAFEGGTGDKGEPGQPASQSLMGFTLLRHWPNSEKYDVHIAFRGSRSGSAGRAALLSLSDHHASGNPDWISDLGYHFAARNHGGSEITTIGEVSRGFAHSTTSILPQTFGCLQRIAKLKPDSPPQRIFVTGHSLGGALAQHFTSAILLGGLYGPDAAGPAMPDSLRSWPWKKLKLITFSAPRSGDARWAQTLTVDKLESVFFSSPIDPIDRHAITVTHPDVLPRLSQTSRPAAYRVLISTDPATSGKLPIGKHIGQTIYVNHPRLIDRISPPNPSAHEPVNIRNFMLESFNHDKSIPPVAWKYPKITEYNPERNPAQKGTVSEYLKLQQAIHTYHKKTKDNPGRHLDFKTFDEDFKRFLSLLPDPE